MHHVTRRHLIVLCVSLFLVACGASTGSETDPAQGESAALSDQEQQLVEQAKALVEREAGRAASELTLNEIAPEEWPDASLGCPQPDQSYSQVVTRGYHIALQDSVGDVYDVRVGTEPETPMQLCRTSEPSGSDGLIGTSWQWQTDQLEDTSNYTIEFLGDGSAAVKADCNSARATYERSDDNQVQIEVPAITMAACPPDSLDRPFLEQLISTTAYALDGEQLVLTTSADPGEMRFTPTGVMGTNAGGDTDESVVSGTVTLNEAATLPEGSMVEVVLNDISLADVAAQEIASETISPSGAGPIPYTLAYDSANINQSNTYAVRAQIRDSAGTLLWTSDTVIPVITQGAPTENVEIVVRQVQ